MKKAVKVMIIASAAVSAWYLSVAASGMGEKKLGKGYTVSETTIYQKCGHEENAEYPLPEAFSGLTPKDASLRLGGQLEGLENQKLNITKSDPSFCRHHYDVTLEDNTIKAVIRRSGNVKALYAVSPSQFPKGDIEKLTAGIKAESDAELSQIIEAYTS